jgi:hypothetical protein
MIFPDVDFSIFLDCVMVDETVPNRNEERRKCQSFARCPFFDMIFTPSKSSMQTADLLKKGSSEKVVKRKVPYMFAIVQNLLFISLVTCYFSLFRHSSTGNLYFTFFIPCCHFFSISLCLVSSL